MRLIASLFCCLSESMILKYFIFREIKENKPVILYAMMLICSGYLPCVTFDIWCSWCHQQHEECLLYSDELLSWRQCPYKRQNGQKQSYIIKINLYLKENLRYQLENNHESFRNICVCVWIVLLYRCDWCWVNEQLTDAHSQCISTLIHACNQIISADLNVQ